MATPLILSATAMEAPPTTQDPTTAADPTTTTDYPVETEPQIISVSPTTAEFPTTTFAMSINFQGWYYGAKTTAQPIVCPTTQTFSITSPYADCLNRGATAVATDCMSNVLTYDGGHTFACPDDASCYVMTVSFTSSSVERYMCAKDWYADIIYREKTESPSSITADTTIPTTTSEFASPTSTQSAETSSSSTGSTGSTGNTSLSGGAIAGIVIGCVVAVLVITLVILRKRLSRLFRKPAPDGPQTEMLDSKEIYEIGHSTNASAVTGSAFTTAVGENDDVQEIGIGK